MESISDRLLLPDHLAKHCHGHQK